MPLLPHYYAIADIIAAFAVCHAMPFHTAPLPLGARMSARYALRFTPPQPLMPMPTLQPRLRCHARAYAQRTRGAQRFTPRAKSASALLMRYACAADTPDFHAYFATDFTPPSFSRDMLLRQARGERARRARMRAACALQI